MSWVKKYGVVIIWYLLIKVLVQVELTLAKQHYIIIITTINTILTNKCHYLINHFFLLIILNNITKIYFKLIKKKFLKMVELLSW